MGNDLLVRRHLRPKGKTVAEIHHTLQDAGRAPHRGGALRSVRALPLGLLLMLLATACGGSDSDSAAEPREPSTPAAGEEPADSAEPEAADFTSETISFAPQFGLAYLPHHVLIGGGFLQDELPGIQVEAVQLSGGGAVVEQLLTGNIDIGYVGVPPFLTAWSAGVDLRVASSFGAMPMQLMGPEEYTDLGDFQSADRIAVPGPSSFQTTTLRAAAEGEFGDSTRFDNSIVGLPHPDAEAALRGGQDITAHFTQPPFSRREAEAGFKQIMTSYDVFGQHTFVVAIVAADFEDTRPEIFAGYLRALESAMELIREDPARAAEIAIAEGDGSSVEDLVTDITSEDIVWDTVPLGVLTIAETMAALDELDTAPRSIADITTRNLHSSGAS